MLEIDDILSEHIPNVTDDPEYDPDRLADIFDGEHRKNAVITCPAGNHDQAAATKSGDVRDEEQKESSPSNGGSNDQDGDEEKGDDDGGDDEKKDDEDDGDDDDGKDICSSDRCNNAQCQRLIAAQSELILSFSERSRN